MPRPIASARASSGLVLTGLALATLLVASLAVFLAYDEPFGRSTGPVVAAVAPLGR